MHHSSLGNWVSVIPTVMAQYGCDGHALLQQLGIATTPPPDGERLPVELTARAWRLAAEQSGDPAIGIRAATFIQPANWHAMGMAALCTRSLREIIEMMSRYTALVSNSVTVSLQDQGDQLVMTTTPVRPGFPGDESLEFGVAAGLHILRSIFPRPLSLTKLELMRQAPADTRAYEDFFGCKVTFAADNNRLFYRHEDVDLPLSLHNHELTTYHEQFMADYTDDLNKANLINRVQREMMRVLPSGDICQDTIASAFNMSARHLQRKLKEHDTCFKQILEELRKDLALTYIKKEKRSLNEVAYQLGFSDHSNFTRAFKRWYGCCPKAFNEKTYNYHTH